jgi:hypothetical protein
MGPEKEVTFDTDEFPSLDVESQPSDALRALQPENNIQMPSTTITQPIPVRYNATKDPTETLNAVYKAGTETSACIEYFVIFFEKSHEHFFVF